MNNPEYQTLYMDFEGFRSKGIFPSDIDYIYVCPSGHLILGEIKHKGAHLVGKQRKIYEDLANNNSHGGTVLFITHDKLVQNGDKSVDVSKCEVEEVYRDGIWKKPRPNTTADIAVRYIISEDIKKNV